MLEKQLQKIQNIQEFRDTFGDKVKASLVFGKMKTGEYVLVIDHKDKMKKARGKFASFFRLAMPVAIVFKNSSDLKSLDKVEKSIDTKVLFKMKAQKILRDLKSMSKGTGIFEARADTLAIRQINLKPFKKNSILVIRIDSFMPSKISKTTREMPANTYYRMKAAKGIKESELNEVSDIQKQQLLIVAAASLVISLAMIFVLLGFFIGSSKRNKKLEKRLNDTLKDGKHWKVYVVKEDSPNAFCIATPRMFIHSGLMKLLTEDEVLAIMLHEAGHINNKDMWKGLAARNIFMAILVGAAYTVPPAGALYIGFMILLFINQTGLQHIFFAKTLGRRAERQADSFAVKKGYGKAMASALDKLNIWLKKQQAKRPCGKVCKMFTKVSDIMDEHPPLEKRVETVLKEKETWDLGNFRSVVKTKNYFMKKLKP